MTRSMGLFDKADERECRVPEVKFMDARSDTHAVSRAKLGLRCLAWSATAVMAIALLVVPYPGRDEALLRLGGTAGFLICVFWLRRIVEAATVRLDERGMTQLTLFRSGRVWRRSGLAWRDVLTIDPRGPLCRFRTGVVDLCVDASYFPEPNRIIRFISNQLPEHLQIRIDSDAVVGPIEVGKATTLVGTGGLILSLAGALWIIPASDYQPVGLVAGLSGGAMVLACLLRAVQSFSTRLDDTGVEQLKIFSGGRFLIRSRLSWDEVVSVSSHGMATVLRGKDVCIRVDYAVFWHPDDVSMFMLKRLPVHLVEMDD